MSITRKELIEKLNTIKRLEVGEHDDYWQVTSMEETQSGRYISLEDIAEAFGFTLTYGDYGQFIEDTHV